jgi:hypothetical protein
MAPQLHHERQHAMPFLEATIIRQHVIQRPHLPLDPRVPADIVIQDGSSFAIRPTLADDCRSRARLPGLSPSNGVRAVAHGGS